jgi:voltage-gated potassium channel
LIPLLLTFTRLFRAIRHGLRQPEFRALSLVVILILVFGTVFYHSVEGWNWLDSLYFCVITLATVGYGDLTPVTPYGKVFTIIYILLGVSVLAGFFTQLARNIIESSPIEPEKNP